MKIKSIEFNNIKSFGNKLQKIEFPNEGGLSMVLGKNGNGKSGILQLPKILLYGRLEDFKKDEIANRLNKHGYIKGFVEINPTTMVCIERSLSPSDLKVYKFAVGEEPNESNDIGKAGISNYQDYIDSEVIGLPFGIFSNIISLSVNDFKSFISMTPHDKRVIIDKLFAMEVINRMNNLVKKDVREIKMNMEMFNREILQLKGTIDSAIKELEKLKTKVVEDNTVKIAQLVEKLTQYKPKLEEAYIKQKTYTDKKEDIKKSYIVFQEQRNKIKNELNIANSKINLYKQDKCPTCETPFTELRFEMLKEELNKTQEEKAKEIEILNLSESTYTSALEKINEGLTKINEFIFQVKAAASSIEIELTRLKAEKPAEFSSIQNIISNNSIILSSKEDEKTIISDDFKYLSILETLYSDNGIKKKILESYLPTLNNEINYTLHELHFPYNLHFNSDFEPELHQLGIDIGVSTLSEGEKKRVDLAVLISIIRMLKRKYPNLNIFMLDEVLSSIDGDGIFDIIGLLQRISKEMNLNIFIINHSPLPIQHFDWRIEVTKNDGFSDLIIEKLGQN